MPAAPAAPPRLRRSGHVSWFTHLGAVYLFHDLYGYLMEMSPDIADLVEAFADGADTDAVVRRFAGVFEDADPRQFVDVLAAHAVLVEPDDDEVEALWAFVPIKGKWNVWQRRDDRLTLWTAWGDRPIQQTMLDPDETRMWDAFDGEKRLNELRQHHDRAKLLALVRRLAHHDVQALKLSLMPWSLYAKRPQLAPPYLSSTMPYPSWRPGTPVPPAPALETYHRAQIQAADAQFDHQETTLSHLLRVPHPALAAAGVPRTYGQALADALLARGAVPDGEVRVLEMGAGLGYVARDLIARLTAAGRAVAYTIVELSPALAAAQQERLAGVTGVRWQVGDVLTAPIAGPFDLILSNEMVGDLPAHALDSSLQPLRESIAAGPWPNRQMLMVPLGSAATLPAQAASLAGHSGVTVRTTPQVSRPADAWSYISGAWNRLNSAPESARARATAPVPTPAAAPPKVHEFLPTQPLELSPMPGVAAQSLAAQATGSPGPWGEYVRRCAAIKGAIECCAFDIDTQRSLAHSGTPRMADRLAAKGTMLQAVMTDSAKVLGLGASHPDATITLDHHHLLLRPVPGHPRVVLHMVLDRQQGNVGLARAQLQQVDQALLGHG